VKRKVSATAFIMVLLLSVAGLTLVDFAIADPMAVLSYITIESDGRVEPQTGFIKQDGRVYTLTSDLVENYAIKIQCSNIVFDGAGHVLSGYGYSNMGLSVEGVTNVTVKDIEVSDFWIVDISISSTTNSVFLGVKAQSFYVENSNFNTIAESNVGYEHGNVVMQDSNSNTFVRNNFNNTIQGDMGNSNTFFENNFWKQQNFSVYEGNFWDNGSIGNYWSWFQVVDVNDDGIGDIPYVIDSNDQDNFPLMNPWDPETPFDTMSPHIVISSPENKVYSESSVLLIFSIREPVSSLSYSLDGQDNVTIVGNTTLSDLENGSYNVTVYATDLAGNTGASETTYFTISKPFPTTLVVTVSGVSIIGVAVCLLYYHKKRNH
jgi:hypothetical protein